MKTSFSLNTEWNIIKNYSQRNLPLPNKGRYYTIYYYFTTKYLSTHLLLQPVILLQ